jgi:C-terminal processing protease CtpA/Prc
MIGFQALRQYDVIVDGVHGFIYFHPKKTSPVVLPHNRLGAVFIPHGFGTKISSSEMKKIGTNTSLEARVATNTPAYEAGIRDGDILLGIEGYNGSTSGGDAMAKLLEHFSAPAGSKMVFNLKRGDKPFVATAILQNILPPSPTAQTPITPSASPAVSLAIAQTTVNLVTNALAGPPDFASQNSHRLLYVELQSLNRAATAIVNHTASDADVQAFHVLLDAVITRAQQIADRPEESRDTVDHANKLVEELTALRKQLP